jgi:Uma2 family endonuclease
MATATPTPTSTGPEVGERRFVIYNLGWQGYQALRKILGDRGPRLTYARGSVELMSPLLPHEGYSKRLGRMVEAICEELEIPMRSARSTTLDREDVDRGVEPDESYYIANVDRIAHREQIDLEVVPPPDLAIEVEITSGILHKLEIYARLGVPELWRFDGEVLTVMLLEPGGSYAPSERSTSFPFLPMGEVARFLLDPDRSDESRWARRFRAWVREVLLPLYRNPAAPE